MLFKDPISEHILGEWSSSLTVGSILFRIALSIILAAVVGWERSSKRHSAGLRTFIVVTLSASAAIIVDLALMQSGFSSLPVLSGATLIGAAMISGNSILFSSRSQIKGLTTSAGLFSCALLGITAGSGLYTATLILFITMLCSLSLFPVLERALHNRSNHFEIHLELKNKSNLQDFVTTIRRLGLRIDDIENNPAYLNSGLSVYSVAVTITSAELKKYKTHKEIIDALATLEYVYHIEEMN